MSYSVKDIPNDSRVVTPEILVLEAGISALKESGEGLIELGRALIEKSVKFEKTLEVVQRGVKRNLISLLEEARKSENHREMVSG